MADLVKKERPHNIVCFIQVDDRGVFGAGGVDSWARCKAILDPNAKGGCCRNPNCNWLYTTAQIVGICIGSTLLVFVVVGSVVGGIFYRRFQLRKKQKEVKAERKQQAKEERKEEKEEKEEDTFEDALTSFD